jgi:anti-sigma factor RsiW
VDDQHASHDLVAVVAFADGELHGPELEVIARQVGECRTCAELVADLRSLAVADRRLGTPVRPRDFRLTPSDAERLGRLGPEPLVVATRLGNDMPATSTLHADHDPERIAAAVGGTLEPAERHAIDAWLADCSACAELHADLLAIVSAERDLPTPSRPRDFRLTPADAHRLRPGGWRAVLAAIGSSRDAFSKPLAIGLTTLGLAGLLVGTAPSLGMSGSATTILSTVGAAVGDTAKSGEPGAQSESYGDGSVFGGQDAAPSSAASAAPAPAPSAAAAVAVPSAAPSAGAEPVPGVAAPIADSAGPREATEPPADAAATDDTTRLAAGGEAARLAESEGPPTLVVVSLLLLLAGLGLFVARWGANRLRGA